MNARFAVFRREVERWVSAFGLKDWKVHIVLDTEPNERNAEISYNWDNRTARITYFTKQTGTRLMVQPPEKSALHEVIHLLMADAMMTAGKKGDAHEDTVREEHRIVERLMGVLK